VFGRRILPADPEARRRLLIGSGIALAVGLALVVVLWERCGIRGCPHADRLSSYQPGGAPVLLDRNGRPFADLAPVEGEMVRLGSLPKYVPQAFVAVEDKRFYEHGGVDWRRVFGALAANLRSGEYEEGFSTITMQLARNVFPERIPGQRRTITRKLLEVRVAQSIEHEFKKDEILELYLNHIYFGNGARGIEAASQYYFGVPSARLSLAQAALLAALPKGPAVYDPHPPPPRARDRRDRVLTLMEQQGKIDHATAEAARQQPLAVVRRAAPPSPGAGLAAYFTEEVRRQLEERYGDALYDEALKIHTTLDSNAQKAAEEELGRQLAAIEGGAYGRFSAPGTGAGQPASDEGSGVLQGAVVAMETGSGDVLAWVGGRDFSDSRFDRVRAARRQAGSAFKPFVYAAALRSGHMLSEHLSDQPLKVDLGGRQTWEPKNFDGTFEAEVTMRDALVRSKNVPTVRLASSVGTSNVAGVAKEAGVQSEISERPSMALGTVAVSPLELTAAYTPFATLGDRVAPRVVVRVERPSGEVLWQAPAAERRHVLEPAIAFLVTDALREALVRGTGEAVRGSGFQLPAAGKTGTTNEGTDAWFIGYTPEVVAGVWIGFDQPRTIVAKATGGRLAAPVWARMMMRLYQGRRPPSPWAPPADVVQAAVDPTTGNVVAEGCRATSGQAYREYFVRGHTPASSCPMQGAAEPPPLVADVSLPPADDERATELTIPILDREEAARARRATDEDEVEPPVAEPSARPLERTPAPERTPAAERTPAPEPTPSPERTPVVEATPTPAPTPSSPY
jgi:penicillin-binding protein 1A